MTQNAKQPSRSGKLNPRKSAPTEYSVMQNNVLPLHSAITFPLQVLIEALMDAWKGISLK